MKIEYTILRGKTHAGLDNSLVEEVNRYIRAGWKPLGAVVPLDKGEYAIQSMVREIPAVIQASVNP